jgi:hypothetical protein
MSYSIHRPTFLFTSVCFVADVINIFAVVAWIFFVSPSHEPCMCSSTLTSAIYIQCISVSVYDVVRMIDNLWFFPYAVDVFTAIWLWKELILGCLFAVFGLGHVLRSVIRACEQPNCYARTRYDELHPSLSMHSLASIANDHQ